MKKARLALDQLEKELALIPTMELARILGGNGSGSSGYAPGSTGYNPGNSGYDPGYGSGNSGYSSGGSGFNGLSPDASIEDVMDYLFNQGVPMTTSSGNYYFMGGSGAFMLNEVSIYGGSNNGSSGSTGSPWYNPYSGFSGSTLDIYVAILNENGINLESDGNGGYSYTGTTAEGEDENEFPYSNADSWEVDENGNIIKTVTNRPIVDVPDGHSHTIYLQEVEITTIDGKTIIAYEALYRKDLNGNTVPLLERHKSNCTGLAFTNGEFWIFDSDNDNDETISFLTDLTDELKYEVPEHKEDAEYVIITGYNKQTGQTSIVHSGYLDSDGNIIHKESGDDIEVADSESKFVGNYMPAEDDEYKATITYYKRRWH